MNAILVSNNGMGDNLYMIGALRFLSKYYEKVYLICKQKYYENIQLFFKDSNIQCIPFNSQYTNYTFNHELYDVVKIIKIFYKINTDIFVCGIFKQYIKSYIKNISYLNDVTHIHKFTQKYNIDYDTVTSNNYSFIDNFYKDIHLNLNIFYDYFYIPETEESMNLYNTVKQYNIIFIQLKSSCGKSLNINRILNTYIFDKNTILLCNDINLYTNCIPNPNINTKNNISSELLNDIQCKQSLAESFVFNKIIYYYHTILNSNEIYLIDSCFIGIVLPLLKLKKLKTNKVRIILRDIANKIII